MSKGFFNWKLRYQLANIFSSENICSYYSIKQNHEPSIGNFSIFPTKAAYTGALDNSLSCRLCAVQEFPPWREHVWASLKPKEKRFYWLVVFIYADADV